MPLITKQTMRTPTQNSKYRSVIDRIAPISFEENDGVKALLYGRSGTGKTTLWATFPKPILAVICSGGSKPGELLSINTPEYRKVIRQVTLHNSEELLQIAEHVTGAGYATIVLDHTSGLQDLALKEILGLEELPAQKTWGLASQQQYGQCTLQCKELIRALLGLNTNVVLVAQEREFNTEGESELLMPFVGAGLTPSLVGWLNAAVDYICQTFIRQKEEVRKVQIGKGKQLKTIEKRQKVKGVEFCLRTAPDPVYITKFRLPKGTPLPDVVVDPDYGKLAKLIRGEGG